MSRVAQLDSLALDSELHQGIWSEFQSQFKPVKYIDEWQLLLHTLIYHFSTHTSVAGVSTYGSQLSGVTYRTSKSTLFLVTVLVRYIHKKLSTLLVRREGYAKLYRVAAKWYHCYDLANFLSFLARPLFLSPIHRLFGIRCVRALDDPNFYLSTVYSGLEFQNRQLMWNALLELLNANFFNSHFFSKRSLVKNARPTGPEECAKCRDVPNNPYSTSCCGATYCYVCVLISLDIKFCNNCGNRGDFSAIPLYAPPRLTE
ncbi:ABL094Wp [Eremothecium gossypii ATCC 10895]|uniref:RING-type E3 ubiquitin transferase (cysteine targeting) n=1 Tax=Eremothecium gossypii (strain ATCC 10895 / CBS 109.51 / FGSC 9923 / NRRL Y-1056) TaxID=284811 RepID=Q75DW7_EREGS|nr:ABL094Wp [Eremothecium gossypii ATCC 10895]AAS50677.1 ABL094Wp [Eremothecium gossypii ATCC 10895]AEY94965.1 FABL094Wp [Eremothecium gossypii FDAG1]